ncbi:MAG TPA: endonuclease/exonuclease/phosphatase family protein [Flavobacteriales bacterium]|nr:endonuclease/exonuclease/phosphatase family protein [Flavobacteriales bacterium]
MITGRSRSRELICATIALALATALALSPDAYLPMLARAFLLQWAMGFALLAFVAALRKYWWMALSALAGSLMTVVQVHVPVVHAAGGGAGPHLRIAQMNVLQPNLRHADVVQCALGSGADLIAVQEVGPEWAAALSRGLADAYPYQHVEPRTNCYGIALFSRVPFTHVGTITVGGSPFIEAMITVGGRSMRVLAVHASSPIDYGQFRNRNAQLRALAREVASQCMPTIVVGDMNTVHWDHAYADLCIRSGLSPLVGTGERSWPSMGPLALIPLDHVLASAEIVSSGVDSFRLPGSDHRGLVADLQLKADAQ